MAQKFRRIINKNTKKIVESCQSYLDQYEKNGKPKYAVDLDKIIIEIERSCK